jgi:hypothetical protein
MLKSYIPEVVGSNLSWDISYNDAFFMALLTPARHAGIVLWLGHDHFLQNSLFSVVLPQRNLGSQIS